MKKLSRPFLPSIAVTNENYFLAALEHAHHSFTKQWLYIHSLIKIIN